MTGQIAILKNYRRDKENEERVRDLVTEIKLLLPLIMQQLERICSFPADLPFLNKSGSNLFAR
jgi:hypothetical protein